jgi:hypothetical protein
MKTMFGAPGILCLSMCACAFIFFSCEDESNSDTRGFWAPAISAEKGDGEALLLLSDPTLFINSLGPVPTHPDFYNILVSNDLETFTSHKRVDYTESTVKVENLENNRPYYFKIAAEKGQETRYSNVVMIIPSPQLPINQYLSNGYPYEYLSTSYDGNYISFASVDHKIYFTTHSGEPQPFIDENCFGGASWSNETNKAVYVKYELLQGYMVYPFQFKLFDPARKSSTELFQIPYDRYLAGAPKFIPGSTDISFLSTEDNSNEMYETYDLWRINPDTKEKTRLTHFKQIGFRVSNYDWSDTGNSIYFEGAMNTDEWKWGIFRFDMVTNTLSTVITSSWYDRRPSLSPANTKIAFVSDRSGREEVWIYDMGVESYRQVTGSNAFGFASSSSNLQWLDDSNLLITAYLDGATTAVTIKLD